MEICCVTGNLSAAYGTKQEPNIEQNNNIVNNIIIF